MQFKKGDKIKFMQKIELANSNIPACSIWEVRDFTEDDYILEGPEGLAFLPFKFVEKYCEITPKKDKHNILHDLIQTDGSVDGEKLMEKLSKQNSVEHPSYYNQGIECLKYINSHKMGFAQGCMVKYATRYLYKGTPIQDLEKIIVYAKSEIERLKAEGNK